MNSTAGTPAAVASPPVSVRSSLRQAHAGVCATRRTQGRCHSLTSRAHIGPAGRPGSRPHSGGAGDSRDRRELTPHPRRRSVITCVLATVAAGLVFLVLTEIFQWTTHPELIAAGFLTIVFVGAVVENAIRFDSLSRPQPTGVVQEVRFGAAGLPA